MEPISTIKYQNIHTDPNQIFLGFADPANESSKQIETTFFGGQPLWLYPPQIQQLICKRCMESKQKQKLTTTNKLNDSAMEKIQKDQMQKLLMFIGQIYCPLQNSRTYHRIIYIFICENCQRNIKVIRQQSPKNQQSNKHNQESNKHQNNQIKFQTVSQLPIYLQTDMITRKQFLKIINQSKMEVQQEIIEQQNDSDEEDQQPNQQQIKQQLTYKLKIKQSNEQEAQNHEQQQNTKAVLKDLIFEAYRKNIQKLNYPILIYGSTPLQYNSTKLNPRHQCTNCNNPLQLQIQITQQLLSLGSKTLAIMDWGAIFIYTCVASCQPKQKSFHEEQVIVQYQLDAIKQQQVQELKKKNKKRLKQKQRKSKSKNKNKNKDNSQTIKSKNQEHQQQGDWD